MNSILPPIHNQSIRATAQREEPDFEELERYFPNHQMSLFIGTWNMHSEVTFSPFLWIAYEQVLFLAPSLRYVSLSATYSLSDAGDYCV